MLRINADTGLHDAGDYRRIVHHSPMGFVEDCGVSHRAPSGHSSNYQVVLPYLGVFSFTVGRWTGLFDANRTLFVTGGQDFTDRHPVQDLGHASLIITPAPEILEEVCGQGSVRDHAAFRDATRPATPKARLLTHRLVGMANGGENRLAGDELTLAALRETIASTRRYGPPISSRIVNRAKQVLHARGCEPLTLDDIAREVGVSGVYLTQEFTRAEGLPLYRYQMRLRLSRALVELPHCDSITRLALDLGFSSHSHFSATFKAIFGITPSGFRSGETRPPASRHRNGDQAKMLDRAFANRRTA